jgi:hypothetical protein
LTDLRQSLSQMLADEPPLPDITKEIVVAGRRARNRRRIAIGAAGTGVGVVIAAAVAMPLALGGGGDRTQTVSIAVTPSATPSTSPSPTARPSTTPSVAGFGFNPAGPTPSCPKGQLPAVSSDLAKVVAHGTYGPADQSWADQYVKPDPNLRGVGFSVAAVNGKPASPATSYLWVVSGPSTTHTYTASVLLVRDSGSTWSGHPATFTGCQ